LHPRSNYHHLPALQLTSAAVFSDGPIALDEKESTKVVPSLTDTVIFTIVSSFSGVCCAYAVHRGRMFAASINSLRIKQPIYAPLIGSLALSALYSQKYIMEGPASLFVNDGGKSPSFSLRRQVLRFFGVAIAIGSGNALGMAGPMAEVGMTVAKTISLLATNFRSTWRESSHAFMMDSLILAGSAAGFAANFDTPLAGVAFALEVIVLKVFTLSAC
jgi:H+/Cl- antiporter ClcA